MDSSYESLGPDATPGAPPADARSCGRPAADIVAEAVRRAAAARVATLGPHLIALVVKASSDMTLPATATIHDPESLADRLRHRAPLTPLADPEMGQDHLGAWGERPSSVGDLLAARGTDGQRVVGSSSGVRAGGRPAPPPGWPTSWPASIRGWPPSWPATRGGAGGGRSAARPAAVLCSELAALWPSSW